MDNEAWFNNSLSHRAKELRVAAANSRTAYNKPFMQEPAMKLAEIYDEAAQLMEDRIIRRLALQES